MSILLDNLSSEYLQVSAIPTLAFPLAMSAWVYIDDLADDQTILSMGNSGSEDNYFSIGIQGLREEVTDITTVANVTSDTLAGKYFLIDSPTTSYYVWFDVSNGSSDPAPVGKTAIEVDISPGDTANQVASALQAAIDAEVDFSASVLSNVVTVTNAATGAVSDAVDVDTGFTINVTTQGTDDAYAVARITDNNGTTEQALTSVGLTVNTWHNVLGMFLRDTGGTDIYAYLDGANGGSNLGGTTVFPSGMNQTAIGRLCKQTPTEYMSGRVAEATIWNLTSLLTSDEIDDLGVDKTVAVLIRSDELALHCPLIDASSPAVEIMEGNDFTLYNTPTTADHPPLQYYEPEIYGRFRSGPIEFNREVIQALTITQTASVEIVVPASSTITFYQTVLTNVISVHVQSNIGFTDEVGRTGEFNISITHALSMEQNGAPTTEDSASNNISFTQEACRGEDPSNDVAFSHSVTEVASTKASNDIAFGHTVAPLLDLTISLSSSVQFTQDVLPYVDVPCQRHEYDPQGSGPPAVSFSAPSSVTLVCGVNNITLPNPEFGNAEESNVNRAYNTARGGTPQVYRESTWPEETVINVTFITMKETKATELKTFLINCLGLEVTYTDQDGRQWTGIILNPEEAVTENREDQFTANIVMSATPV